MATVTKPIALDESFNTTELTPRNIADVLAQELSRITGRNASQVEYDNTESGLTADNVQEALDEIVEDIPTVPSVDIQTAVDEFSTYNGGLLSSLKVALSPNQDLHGYDSPWVGGAGKNKAQDPKTGVYSSITGEWSGGDVYAHSIAKVNPNTTYTMSVGNVGNVSALLYYNNDPSSTPQNYFISAESVGAVSTYTFTTPPTAQYVIYETGSSATPRTKDNVGFIQIELGSTATAFEPYSNICPISGHTQVDVDVSDGQTTQEQVTVNLGGTYYSGTLDVVSGVFVPDTASVEYDGSADENWIKVSGEYRYYIEKPSDINANPDGSTSNEFKYSGTSGASVPDGQFYVGGTNLGVRLNTITSVADWKTFLSNNPFMVVYPLATPTSIQLSPTMVKALVGENHLSAPLEGQEITESKYKQAFTFDDVIAYIQSLS